MRGFYTANLYASRVLELYDTGGDGSGLSTGLPTLDRLLTIAPGLHVVTGLPGHGKSALMDQIVCDTAHLSNMKWAILSMENAPETHLLKLAAMSTTFLHGSNKPFHEGHKNRMTRSELSTSLDWLSEQFVFLNANQEATADNIIDRVSESGFLLGDGPKGLLIDPYNCLEMTERDDHRTIQLLLAKLTSFAASKIAVFVVAHPQKIALERISKPLDGNTISGSHTWQSRADVGISVFREPGASARSTVRVWKSRHPWVATCGQVTLSFDSTIGRFSDEKIPDDGFNWSLEKS